MKNISAKLLLAILVFCISLVMWCCRVQPGEDEDVYCPPWEDVTIGDVTVRHAIEECDDGYGVVCCRVVDECEC